MINKKIAAILAITLTGSYIIPTNVISSTVTNKVVLAQHVQNESSTEKNTEDKKNDDKSTVKTTVNQKSEKNTVVNQKGYGVSSANNISNSNIQIINGWGTPAGLITFNPQTQKIEVNQYNAYLGHNGNQFLKIGIYNPANQKMVMLANLNGNDNTSALSKVLNNVSFSYGDELFMSYDSTQGEVVVNSGEDSIGNANGQTEVFTITKNGLIASNETMVNVNPLAILDGPSEKITKGILTGKVNPNEIVSATINGKVFQGKSDANGNYSINIEDVNGFTSNTQIELTANGYIPNVINPTLNDSIKIQKSTISFSNNWHSNICTIGFNPNSQKIQFQDGGNGTNPYLGSNDEAFKIVLYNSNGEFIKSVEAYGSSYPQNKISAFLNNLPYNYGEYIELDHVNSTHINVSNSAGNNYNVTGNQVFEITKQGLEESKISSVPVNPIDILNSTEKVTTGVITGKVNPNEVVNATINGKVFETKSDANGNYSINIQDSNGFSINTNIEVNADGYTTTFIKPTFNSKLGIFKSSILIHGEDGVIAQNITFNPNTMTVSNVIPWGGQFSAEIIDKDTGKVVASTGTGNFNIDGTKQLLNGASFKFGDIISLYESEQENLSFGNILLSQNGQTTDIKAEKNFKSYEITPQGLVPVANKNMTVSGAVYNGTQNIPIQGKTLPNTPVKVFYNGNTDVVKSNSNGEFSLNIPLDKTSIGSEVRVFVNNQNNKNLIVGYDQKQFTIQNNNVQIVNNEGFPVINISFNPVNNKIISIPYPRTVEYAGVFYGNRINIKLIDGQTGKVIKNVVSNKSGEITSFAKVLNNVSYENGDILEIQYDNSLVSANVINNKKNIGNTTGKPEYFKITNEGLEAINNEFITVNPLDILSNQEVKTCNVTGKVSKNEEVTATVGGKTFKAMSDSNGNFSIPISLGSGFTQSTQITLSAQGYKTTTVEPTFEKSIGLMNSYINFYNSNGRMGNILSSIGFNIQNGNFIINNYSNSFGGNASNYFTLGLYNPTGKNIFNYSFNGESTNQLNQKLSNQKFALGDIIALSYNAAVSKPAIVNGSNVIGNVSGQEEYFKITKEGLVRVNFGSNSTTNSVQFNNGNLDINLNLAYGQDDSLLNGNLVILNDKNQVIATGNSIKTVGTRNVEGVLSANELSKIDESQSYTIALDLNGKIQPIYVDSNTWGNNDYDLSANSQNELQINKKAPMIINIKNSNDLSTCLTNSSNSVSKYVNSNNVTEVLNNPTLKYNMLVTNFINTVGLQNLENLFNKSTDNANFINWVLNNPTAMTEFLNAPSPNGTNVVQCQTPGTYTQALSVWSDIWNTYTSSHNGFDLKLAIATAITNAAGITAFPTSQSVGSPVQRYEIFKTLNDEGKMLPIFKTLDVTYLTYVVDTIIPNNQILEMRDIILQNHNAFVNDGYNGLNNIAYTINYNETNPYTGASIFGNGFYGPNPTISDVWYDGGVCGEISRMGTMASQVFGAPAAQTGQPGHDAFLYFTNSNKKWNVGNDIFGWNLSEGSDISGWATGIAQNNNIACYNLVYENAQKNLPESNEYVLLSNTNIDYSQKIAALKEAINLQPLNINAWKSLIALYNSNSNTTLAQYNQLGNQITSLFSSYSIPMSNLLHYLYEDVLQEAITQADLNESSINSPSLKLEIANANKVLQSTNVTQSQILNAFKELNYKQGNTQEQIKKLKALIAKSKVYLKNSIYTSKSITNLAENIESGEIDLNNPNVSSMNILNDINNISNSLNNLKLIPLVVNEVFAQQNEVIGKAAPNATVVMNLNGKEYTVKANSKGDFEISNLPQFNCNEKFEIYSQENNLKTVAQEVKVNGLGSYDVLLNEQSGSNLATISFNTQQKQLEVNNGNNSTINPGAPSNQKAFVISLLNNNKKTIKTVTVYSDYLTGENLCNDLNGLNFEYGDYLEVDFKGSSSLYLNYVIDNGDFKQNYQINSNDLFKITPNGLEIGINTTNNKNNEPKKNSSVDNAQLENQLKLDIASANRMMNNSGYTLGSKNTLGEAINAGNAVLANKNATSDEIISAINSLISAYKGLVVDTAGLKNDVKEVQTLVNSGNYTKESELSLENAIKEANNLLNSNNITSLGVENAIDQLNSAAKSLVVQKKEATQKVEIKNNVQTLYFANISGVQSLVINGNVDGADIPANVSKELVIENYNGQVIDTINTTPVNWYSKNKENYSGYQGIISGNILSKLEVGENYKVGIKYDGQVHMLNSKVIMPSYGQYRVENSNGNVVIQKSNVIQEGTANCETGYVYNNGFIINVNINLNGDVIPASVQKQIVITEENGKVVYESNTIPVNWYSSNKNDYSGLQAYIPQSELSKLNATGNYKISILVTEGSKKYSMPVKGFVNASTDGYKLYNNGDVLSITKAQNVNASAKIENKYQDGDSTVINAMMNIENVPAGSSAMLKITENDGTVKEVNGVLVNWYSKDKNNLNGVQFVINSKIIENAKSSNIVVSVGNKNYNCNL